MKYYIGIDSIDLEDKYGYGCIIVCTQNEDGFMIIHKQLEIQNKIEFYQELQRIKDQYQPHEIQEWSL